jgi:hypothetical protein
VSGADVAAAAAASMAVNFVINGSYGMNIVLEETKNT